MTIVENALPIFERFPLTPRNSQVPDRGVILPPGISFGVGDSISQNHAVLANLRKLSEFGRAIFVGLSHTRTTGRLADAQLDGRLIGAVRANLLRLGAVARVMHSHDVAEHANVVQPVTAVERPK